MNSQRIVRQVEISVFIHATEDRAKVLKAVRNLFPKEVEFPNYSETVLNGYFGDPIVTLFFRVKHRRSATEFFDNIIVKLSSLDYDALLNELPQRIDETKNLYLRINKQNAYLGNYMLGRHDPIRIKVSLLVPHKVEPVDYLREYLEAKRS